MFEWTFAEYAFAGFVSLALVVIFIGANAEEFASWGMTPDEYDEMMGVPREMSEADIKQLLEDIANSPYQ
ncbi:MAG: hypothetical protein RIQ56_936 [Candidatus Parcubacteria bacterium]|jgi:hypothetical protein